MELIDERDVATEVDPIPIENLMRSSIGFGVEAGSGIHDREPATADLANVFAGRAGNRGMQGTWTHGVSPRGKCERPLRRERSWAG